MNWRGWALPYSITRYVHNFILGGEYEMKIKRILRTAIPSILIVLTLVVAIVANVMIPPNMNAINGFLGDSTSITIRQPNEYNDSLDLQYNKSDYTAEEMPAMEQALNEEIMGEGVILLKNDGLMPFGKDTTFSFFGRSCTKLVGNTWYDITIQMGFSADPGTTLRMTFQERGFGVNETLWNFYDSGNGSNYGLGPGSVGYGDAEDFSINECPLDIMEKEPGLLDSANGTVPVFVWGRKVGEGRDMPRSMYNHADNPEDQAKSYLEPDSTELEILSYLNDNYEDVVLLVNSSAAMELGWVDQFPSIKSILYVPSAGNFGLYAVADVFSGDINPSGKTVDTFAYDAASAPAAANYGDFQYTTESGEMTKYNYVAYKEGIYVGYTAFDWSNFKANWSGDTCTVTVDVKNTGSVAGKDVVQVYVQSPYTDYDKQNKVEKSAVQLVGFGKTELLQPGQSGTVTVTFDKEQLKAYDYTNAKTFILDAGDYYITAAHDAHNAVNNVLAAKGFTTENGMTEEGDAVFTSLYTVSAMDSTTYATSAAGVAITNHFDFVHGGYEYLSRNDWQGTWPTTDGEVSSQISTWGNEINSSDGKSYTYTKTIGAEGLAELDGFDSLNPMDASSFTAKAVYGAKNGLQLIDLRGRDYDDPLWDKLLDQLTPEDYQTIIATSGYGNAELESVSKPFALDQDAATGLTGGGTRVSYCGTLVLAQTWNQELAARYGEMIGNQAIIGGCVGWYAPAMNIHRLPFSGRNNEYYSEDGYLSGAIASATSRGAASKGMYTFIKHFALNDQENHRGDRVGNFGVCTWSNEQAIREIYLLPFQMCVENDPVTLNYVEGDGNGGFRNATRDFPAVSAIMTAFNRLGYTWTGGCYPLITEVLRNEWGFNGFVITDNANPGSPTYMNAYQMLEAGGDAALTTSEYAVWKFDKDNASHYVYGREAMHHVLYAVANSKVMSGLMPGFTFTTPMTIAEKIVIGVNIGSVVIIAALGYFIYHGFRKSKK